jgi:broad specificity phosphatase PhoE
MQRPEVVLVRHGETEWSRTGQHTGRTDLPLTPHGLRQAEALANALAGRHFERVLTSPLARAVDTCRLAGFAGQAQQTPDLMEWDYGDYEGRTTPDIRAEVPGWSIWRDSVPNGETAADVGRRADRVIGAVRLLSGDAALFAHGHVLRVLAARWLGLAPAGGRFFALDTATVCLLGWEREIPVLERWNEPALYARLG